jgi:hypothetical protein
MPPKKYPDPNPDMDFLTIPPEELENDFYYGVGRLVHNCGRAEAGLSDGLKLYIYEHVLPSMVLRQHPINSEISKISLINREIIQSFISNMAVSNLKETYRKILKITKAPSFKIDELNRVFNHMSIISSIRNMICHNGGYADLGNKEGWYVISNSSTIDFAEKSHKLYLQPHMLLEMADDMWRIPDFIHYILHADEAWTHQGKVFDASKPLAHLPSVFTKPWSFDPTRVRRVYRSNPKQTQNHVQYPKKK